MEAGRSANCNGVYVNCDQLPPQDQPANQDPNGQPPPQGQPQPVQRPRISPEQLALRAAAVLRLKTPGLGAAPNTEANGLVIDTAVGYPVWLWSEGNTGTLTATDSDGDLKVLINASITSVTYAMGDGTTVSCGTGTKWKKGNGSNPSPTCGHVYQEMGRYTISATTTWSANWSAANQTGTIPLTRTTTRAYRVGEIQALVTKR